MNAQRENVGIGDARLRHLLALGLLVGSLVLLTTGFGAIEIVIATAAIVCSVALFHSAHARYSSAYRVFGLDTSEYARMPPDERPDLL